MTEHTEKKISKSPKQKYKKRVLIATLKKKRSVLTIKQMRILDKKSCEKQS